MPNALIEIIMQILEKNDCTKCIHKVEGIQHQDIIWCKKHKMPLYQLRLNKCIYYKLNT